MDEFISYLMSLSEEDKEEKVHIYLLLLSILDQWKASKRADLKQTLTAYQKRYISVSFMSVEKRKENAEFISLDFGNKKISEIHEYLSAHAVAELRKNNFAALAKSAQGEYFFKMMPQGLKEKLAEDGYTKYERILILQLSRCFGRETQRSASAAQQVGSSIMASNLDTLPLQAKKKIVLTPQERLSHRIIREFKRVKLIGDIQINEEEYAQLKQYFISCYSVLSSCNVDSVKSFDETFAVALVQIGMRCYQNGIFWPEFEKELGIKISLTRRSVLVHSFILTMKKFNKMLYSEETDIENILTHSFVSNHYLDDFFMFLFTYYRIDMERDMEQCHPAALVNAINNNVLIREQYIRKHTHKALKINPLGSKIRIRKMLKCMDQLFYDENTSLFSCNRIYSSLARWAKESRAFDKERECYVDRVHGGSGRKMLSSPYIKADFDGSQSFSLVIPAQLISSDDKLAPKDIFVKIKSNYQTISCHLEILRDRGIMGFRTEPLSIEILPAHIFSEFSFELTTGDTKLKSLAKISKSIIRFFNDDGFLQLGEKLRVGKQYAYTQASEEITSSAGIDTIVFGDIRRTDLMLEDGDIVFLPDGKTVSAGKRIEEGVSDKGLVRDIDVMDENSAIRLFCEIPYVILKVKPDRMPNTLITINGTRHRASDIVCREFALNDNSDEKGYYIQLANLNVSQNGIYSINVSVPNDYTNRSWKFALLHNFKFTFEGAPYFFEPTGCISFDGCEKLTSLDKLEKFENHSYGFEILPGRTNIQFEAETANEKLHLSVPIPALFWKYDETEVWQTKRPDDLWYDQLPNIAFVMCPANEFELKIRDLPDEEEDTQYIFQRSVSKGYYVCDLTKLKSQLDKRRPFWIIDLEVNSKSYELHKIGTKNMVIRATLKPDYDLNGLWCEIDYFGKNPLVFDLQFDGRDICEKVPVGNEPIFIETSPIYGLYSILTYEVIESDLGFDDACEKLETSICELIDPSDFSNKSIILSKLIDNSLGGLGLPMKSSYKIFELTRINRLDYAGKMFGPRLTAKIIPSIDVHVHFFHEDEHRCYVTCLENDCSVDLLYDKLFQVLEKDQEPGVFGKTAYMRYRLLDDSKQVFEFEFLNNTEKRK